MSRDFGTIVYNSLNLFQDYLDAFDGHGLCQCVHDSREVRLECIVQRLGPGIGIGVDFTCCRIAEQKSLVLGQNRIVFPAKPVLLMRLVAPGSDEPAHLRFLQEAENIVVVTHEIDREVSLLLLLPELRRDGLELFDEGVARMIADHINGPVVGHFSLVSKVVGPGRYRARPIGCHNIKTHFKKDEPQVDKVIG